MVEEQAQSNEGVAGEKVENGAVEAVAAAPQVKADEGSAAVPEARADESSAAVPEARAVESRTSSRPYSPRPGQGRPQQRGSGGERWSGGERGPRTDRRFGRRLKKVCQFCKDGKKGIDHKRADTLRRFITERGDIRSRRKVGTCAKHQRQLAVAIKRARHLALLPYTADHIRGV